MAKRDNLNFVLMTHRVVNLKCDGEIMKCRYINKDEKKYGTWWLNDVDSGLQVIALIKKLKSEYKHIQVTYKRQY